MALRLQRIAMDTVLRQLPDQVHRLPDSLMKNLLVHFFLEMFTEMGKRAEELALSLHPDARAELKKILATFKGITSITSVITEFDISDEDDEDRDIDQEVQEACVGLIWNVSDFQEGLEANEFQEFLEFLEFILKKFIDSSFILPGPVCVDSQMWSLKHHVRDVI